MKDATLAQGNQVLNLILQKRVSAEKIQRLVESGFLSDLLDADFDTFSRDEFRRVLDLEHLQWPEFRLWYLDYDKSLPEVIEKSGCWVLLRDDEIEECDSKFRTERGNSDIMALFRFKGDPTTSDIVFEMVQKGYEPANMHELLALSREYPHLQRMFPIVGLGSILKGGRALAIEARPTIFENGPLGVHNDRILTMVKTNHRWDCRYFPKYEGDDCAPGSLIPREEFFRFAAVRLRA
jgi:hypothetical protein